MQREAREEVLRQNEEARLPVFCTDMHPDQLA